MRRLTCRGVWQYAGGDKASDYHGIAPFPSLAIVSDDASSVEINRGIALLFGLVRLVTNK